MAFVDELTFHARAGHGGSGVVRWLHLKAQEFSGPAGGDGGRGGDVVVRGIRDLAVLARYTGKKEFLAENGGNGESISRHGRNGNDVVVDLPLGSIVTNLETGKSIELLSEGETHVILEGGRGGLGNEYFKSSTNRSPTESTEGRPGKEGNFKVELQLIADAGFIGLPNAGKSTLLNSLTNAKAKVGNYAFTTLEPNLGVMYGYVLADIPGLIEGASEGKGLGHKFLRHIRRTKALIHCVAVDSPDPVADYRIVREELKAFDEILLTKPEMIVLTKTDTTDAAQLTEVSERLLSENSLVVAVSILDDESLKALQDKLTSFLSGIS